MFSGRSCGDDLETWKTLRTMPSCIQIQLMLPLLSFSESRMKASITECQAWEVHYPRELSMSPDCFRML